MSFLREPISKKIRFEVFKRDKFTCQYCGRSAPDAILEIEHIKPVSKGGANRIINLLTACKECNAGKGPRELSDASEIEKQKQQLDELQERRNQLTLLMKWRDGLDRIREKEIAILADKWHELSGGYATETGFKKFRLWRDTFSLPELLDAMGISFRQYVKNNTQEELEKAFTKIRGIAYFKQNPNPALQDILYARAVIRNISSASDYGLHCLTENMKRANALGLPSEDIKQMAKAARSYSSFRDWIEVECEARTKAAETTVAERMF